MRKNYKKVIATILAGCMILGTAGCGSKEAEPTVEVKETVQAEQTETTAEIEGEASKEFPEPVELTIATFRVGTHNAAAAEARYLKEFQEKYNGIDNQKITLKIEEMPSDEEYYKQMKVRATSNDLPDVFEGNGGVLELAVENGIAVDMTQYVDAEAEYKEALGEAYGFGKQWKDGGLYNVSYGLQAIGYFYNKEMYEKAGITVPTTWEEWMSNLDKLKSTGACKAPISMMTSENCWTTNLILASMIGTNGENGNSFMNTKYVDTYQTTEFVDAMTNVQKMLKEYSMPDAVGSDYATAANHFLNEETAIIANGPWMAPDFANPEKAAEGFADKVGVALYPEGGSVSQFERGYSISKSDKAREDAAFKFIQFKTDAYGQLIHLEEAGVLPLTSNVEMSEEYKKENPLVVEFVGLLNGITYKYQTIDTISYATAINAFPTLYPELVSGSLSPEEMAKKLDELAAKDALYKK